MLGENKLAARTIMSGTVSILALTAAGIMIDGMMGAAVAYLINRVVIAVVLAWVTNRRIKRLLPD